MTRPFSRPRDLTELLSEVYDADTQANNPRTRDFLEAGERLLHEDLARDAGEIASAGGRPPFEEVLAWLSRRRVVTEALRYWKPDRSRAREAGPTEAAFRYRWRTQAGYLRDLVIWALSPRMMRPDQVVYADGIIDTVASRDTKLAAAIRQIAFKEVEDLGRDKAFRLQMIFQATLAHDPQVESALRRIDAANVGAWTDFARRSFDKLGYELREGLSFELLGCALHAAGEGVMFRELLSRSSAALNSPSPSDRLPAPAELLTTIAMALFIAFANIEDGMTIDQVTDKLGEMHLAA